MRTPAGLEMTGRRNRIRNELSVLPAVMGRLQAQKQVPPAAATVQTLTVEHPFRSRAPRAPARDNFIQNTRVPSSGPTIYGIIMAHMLGQITRHPRLQNHRSSLSEPGCHRSPRVPSPNQVRADSEFGLYVMDTTILHGPLLFWLLDC